jgi:hypothetical protein
MKQQEVFKKIGIIIKELNDQYDYLVANEHGLNDLELELFVANAHFLADHSEVLRKLSQQSIPPSKTSSKSEEKFFEPMVQQMEPKGIVNEPQQQPAVTKRASVQEEESPVPHIDLRGDDTGVDYSYIRQQESPVIRHELNLEDTAEWKEESEGTVKEEMARVEEKMEEKPAVAEAVKEEPVTPVKETPKVVEHKKEDTSDEPLTINQRISAQLNKTAGRAGDQSQAQPISDLKQAITLNDKLLYTKDLFNGYNLAYSEAIDILNRYNSFDEAEKFLKANYAIKNAWETKQATADKFYELVKRRYL